jgi:hypothetical protein
MHKWIPEFIISIIYVGTFISEPIKQKRKEKVEDLVKKTKRVDLKFIRKILRMDKKNFHNEIRDWAEKFGYIIENSNLVIPDKKLIEFLELLNLEKPFFKNNLEGNGEK